MNLSYTVWLSVYLISRISIVFTQQTDFKKEALEEFKKENYPKAIQLLHQALELKSEDPEIYYYLGYFNHYLTGDSVPFIGSYDEKSDEVLEYLNKAITLDPNYGNAYYFIGAEYGGRALRALQSKDKQGVEEAYRLGREHGGFPDWLLEYGRNNLRCCERDAILFVGGDADYNPIRYLQILEKYRTDVTVIPMGLLNRPWFVLMLKIGFDDVLTSVPIRWSEDQILDLHPYNWGINNIEISLPPEIVSKFNVGKNHFNWELKPDLKRGEREYLSPIGAVFSEIIQANQWRRPIYFSIACDIRIFLGLSDYSQLCGLNMKLLPLKTRGTTFTIEEKIIEKIFMNRDTYQSLKTVVDKNMPRVSRMLVNYRIVLLQLASHYIRIGKKKDAIKVVQAMEKYIPEEYIPLGNLEKSIIYLKQQLEI